MGIATRPTPEPTADELFNDALDQHPGERDQFLQAACAGNISLESEVKSLLACHRDHRGFLERATPMVLPDSADVVVGSTLSIPTPPPRPEKDSTEKNANAKPGIGDFGHYRLLEELGRGGSSRAPTTKRHDCGTERPGIAS